MKHLLAIFIVFLSFVSTNSAQNQFIKFDESKLLERQKKLSSNEFEGRKTGEKGNDSARAYIIDQFKSMNANGYKGTFEYPFSFQNRGKQYNGTNILVEITGTQHPEKYIVISAHHDHLGAYDGNVYNGADDNASGVSALLSFTEFLTKNPPKYSVLFAVFDAEELGLNGAKHFVKTFETNRILVNLNMDMISRSAKNELYVVGARYNSKLKTILNTFDNPTTTTLLQGHDGTDGKSDWTYSSDHSPFHNAKIPFLYFGNEDHQAYHKTTDIFEDTTPQFYKNSVKIILAIFEAIDTSGL